MSAAKDAFVITPTSFPELQPGDQMQFFAKNDAGEDVNVQWTVLPEAGTIDQDTGLLTAGSNGGNFAAMAYAAQRQTFQIAAPVSVVPPNAAAWFDFTEGAGDRIEEKVSGQHCIDPDGELNWVLHPTLGWGVKTTGRKSLGIPVNLSNSHPIFKAPPPSYSVGLLWLPDDAVTAIGVNQTRYFDTDAIAGFVVYPNTPTGGQYAHQFQNAANNATIKAINFQKSPLKPILSISQVRENAYNVWANLNAGVSLDLPQMKKQYAQDLPASVSVTWGSKRTQLPILPTTLFVAGSLNNKNVPKGTIFGAFIITPAMTDQEIQDFALKPFGK